MTLEEHYDFIKKTLKLFELNFSEMDKVELVFVDGHLQFNYNDMSVTINFIQKTQI